MSEFTISPFETLTIATDPLTIACHNYAVRKLKEKFGENGHCTMMDYVMFYGEELERRQRQ